MEPWLYRCRVPIIKCCPQMIVPSIDRQSSSVVSGLYCELSESEVIYVS